VKQKVGIKSVKLPHLIT